MAGFNLVPWRIFRNISVSGYHQITGKESGLLHSGGSVFCMRQSYSPNRVHVFYLFPFLKVFWLTVVLANRIEYLYAGRVFAGIAGGGTSIAIPLFVSEISDDT